MSLQHQEHKEQKRTVESAVSTSSVGSGRDGSYITDNRPEALAQRKLIDTMSTSSNEGLVAQLQSKANNTGLPNSLKSGIENLSGMSMDDVQVHYNSPKPAQLQAHAYAQGSDIHLASGQEKHLPHEAWHVVQQKQGRVKPTMQLQQNVNINDDAALEKEADVMGSKAVQRFAIADNRLDAASRMQPKLSQNAASNSAPFQRKSEELPIKILERIETGAHTQRAAAPPGTILQMVKIDVRYNNGEGRLISSLGYLAEKDQAWYDSFPNDAYPAIFAAVDAILNPIEADQMSIAIIKHRVSTAQANFDNSQFGQAPPGKKQAAVQGGYNEIHQLIQRISDPEFDSSNQGFVQGAYDAQLRAFSLASLTGLNHGTNLYRLYYTPYSAIPAATKIANAALNTEIMNLFKWLYPLDRSLVKGFDDIQAIKNRLETLLLSKISLLRQRGGGVAALPEEALIKHGATQNIRGAALGTESEIVTSRLGALKSGEASEGRGLETQMSIDSHLRFVAGHLVAGSLGGKFAAYNLTPMTETFNTTAVGMATPENAARTRINNQGKVIHYKVTVTYANAALQNWRAWLPATIRIELSDMAPKLGSDAANISNYQVKSNTQVFTPNIGGQA